MLRGRASMAEMPLMPRWQRVSHPRRGRNASACDPGGERFEFQVGRAGAKRERRVSAYRVVLRDVTPSATSKARGQKLRLTHAGIQDHDQTAQTHGPRWDAHTFERAGIR